MSLVYSTLKTEILSIAHRATLTTEVAGFIRRAEGVIARELRCAEMIDRVTLAEADRSSEGIYNLPADYLEERTLYGTDANGDPIALEKVSLARLRRLSGSADVLWYSPISKTEIEFRGVPATDEEIELIYFARPATLSGASDTNDILTNHESIYIDASLHFLYLFTQDLELAQTHAGIAIDAINTLNEQAGRLLGGARTAPGYNLSSYGAR